MRQPEIPQDFEVLLEYLKRNRGFDFTGYKSSSVQRRVTKRMQTVGVDSFAAYMDYLEVHPDEFPHLFNTILINVTGFFRDASTWEFVSAEVIPRIVASGGGVEPIRVWSAGCASGEEPYTAAIAFAEVMGVDEFRDRVKIYATDLDDEALTQARQATYSAKDIQGVPSELVKKYFEYQSPNYVVQKDLRKAVIFGRHDLIQDAPISRVDLLICRNTLMYFNAETQARILARFHFALKEGGVLFLGKAEMLFSATNTFAPVDLRRRIFTKVHKGNLRERLLLMAQAGQEDAAGKLANHVRIREAAFDSSVSAQLVIDNNRVLILANERARQLFEISLKDLGRPVQELAISYRPIDLGSMLEQAVNERRAVQAKDVFYDAPGGSEHVFDIQVTALFDNNGPSVGALVSFTDVTRYKHLQQELQESNQELESAYAELQSTGEELETTNEELQSTVEELETTNEELQSTNEELETTNEELHSANEELQTINDELRQRSDDLNHANRFMAAILTSLRGGVMVFDKDMRVLVWSERCEEMWGVRAEEALGQHFTNLDIGLPVDDLRPHIRACILGETSYREVMLPATNRRGRTIQCHITLTPLIKNPDVPAGAIMLAEEVRSDGTV